MSGNVFAPLAGAKWFGVSDEPAEFDDIGEALEFLDCHVGGGESETLVGYVPDEKALVQEARRLAAMAAERIVDNWSFGEEGLDGFLKDLEAAIVVAIMDCAPSRPAKRIGSVSLSREDIDAALEVRRAHLAGSEKALRFDSPSDRNTILRLKAFLDSRDVGGNEQ